MLPKGLALEAPVKAKGWCLYAEAIWNEVEKCCKSEVSINGGTSKWMVYMGPPLKYG